MELAYDCCPQHMCMATEQMKLIQIIEKASNESKWKLGKAALKSGRFQGLTTTSVASPCIQGYPSET